MEKNLNGFLFSNFKEVAKEFSSCMQDYLYVYDIKTDTYYITERALDRFKLPSAEFQDVANMHRTFVHPDDIDYLLQDLDDICTGKKDSHNLTYRWLSLDGSPIWIQCKGRVLPDADGNPHLMIGCINEVGKKQLADNNIGLLKEDAFEKHISILDKSEYQSAYLLSICVDQYKKFIEKYGVEHMDRILRIFSECVQENLGDNQYAYSNSKDEITILDLSRNDYFGMKILYNRIRHSIDLRIREDGYNSPFTISGGSLKLYDCEDKTYSTIYKYLEFSVQEAKNRGENQIYFFDSDDYEDFLRRQYLIEELRASVLNNFRGFDLYFQPIVSRADQSLHAAESLLRFYTSKGEIVSPIEFIPLLEDTGLILPVGHWTLDRALEICKEGRMSEPDFKVTVNFSYIQLLKGPMYTEVMSALKRYQLPPDALIVELTESGHLENTPAVQNVWRKLKSEGVSIAIDDFGTGYSNLVTIGNLRPQIVKIDRSFTSKALHNAYEHELLIHIIKMVHSLDSELVIEGIETKDELDEISTLHPDYIQGYYYSKPCNRADFLAYIHSKSISA